MKSVKWILGVGLLFASWSCGKAGSSAEVENHIILVEGDVREVSYDDYQDYSGEANLSHEGIIKLFENFLFVCV